MAETIATLPSVRMDGLRIRLEHKEHVLRTVDLNNRDRNQAGLKGNAVVLQESASAMDYGIVAG